MVFHDVSQERRLQRALTYQATHDALTGLINRREFEVRLNEALRAARAEPPLSHVLMYLDLDQFKVVNDTCGHEAGDRLLKQITSVVQAASALPTCWRASAATNSACCSPTARSTPPAASPKTCARQSRVPLRLGRPRDEHRRVDRPRGDQRQR